MALNVPNCHTFTFCFLMTRRPPRSTLFPYTTLSDLARDRHFALDAGGRRPAEPATARAARSAPPGRLPDRKSTRLNSSHQIISYAVFCLKKKKYNPNQVDILTKLATSTIPRPTATNA